MLASAMTALPTPPPSFTFDDVHVVFSHLIPEDQERGFVPAYHFIIRNAAGKEAGHINFRIGNTGHVLRVAGHIGYEIQEKHRGHRYALKACRALGPWIAGFGTEIIITADPDNIPSLRTIEALGAEFINEIDVPQDDPHFARGSFRKRRYRWTPDRPED